MYFLKIHMVGWALTFALILIVAFKNRSLKRSLQGINKKHVTELLKLIIIPGISLLLIFTFFIYGRYLPFETTPKVYTKITKLIQSEKAKIGPDIKRSLAFCGIGNIHRCKCEMDVLARQHSKNDLLQAIGKTIDKGIIEQSKTDKFLR